MRAFAGGGVAIKTLAAAVLAASMSVVMPAGAEEVVMLDLSDKPADIPTLDYLKENNILIPQKGAWDKPSQTWGEAEPIQSPGSAYSLTKVETDGRNVLKKYEFNKESGQLEPAFYQVDLNTTVYGAGEQVKYFEWSTDENGKRTFGEVSAPTEGETTIEYRYDTDKHITVYDNQVSTEFIKTENDYKYYMGGALKVKEGESASITDTLFVNNTLTMPSKSFLYGGALYNAGNIETIVADFVGNSAAAGGALYTEGTIGNITGNFIGNSATGNIESAGGAILNFKGAIGDITGDFVGNSAAVGGALYTEGTIGNITGDFVGNSASLYSGAIANGGTIGNITGDFIGNSVFLFGGAIVNAGSIGDITGDFIGNSANGVDNNFAKSNSYLAQGGAIYNTGNIGSEDGGIINSNFYDNYVHSEKQAACGGAIYTTTDLNIIADSGSSTFRGNYVQQGEGEKDYQAIWVDSQAKLHFVSNNNGSINMYDNINGSDGYTVDITGDGTGTMNLYNDIYNANVQLGNTHLNTINNDIHEYHFNNFELTNNATMSVDVDLANETMDRITADSYCKEMPRPQSMNDSYGIHNGDLIISGMNLMSDLKEGEDSAAIFFAEEGLKDNVKGALALPDSFQTTAYTPIYKYDVNYDNREDGGYFLFNRGGAITGNASDNFNPAVLSTPVANQTGSQAVINETVRFAFQHMDMFSQMPLSQRIGIINNNRYAISEGTPQYNPNFEQLNKGYWIKPFTSFESINLKHGPDVDAITYGTLVGFDSNFREMKKGWHNVQSVYAGYNGSSLSYQNVDTTLNGGLLGLTETFYKGNFFTALTATAGASLGTSRTMYGNEDFTALLGGIGTKSGYNFEFKGGKYILQPILFANYSFVNTFDYTNAAGVKIESDPLHTLQINPQVKFVANLKKGWQPYASVGVVWNVLNSSKVRANEVLLPKMTVDPYVEYGVGIQRNWKERFTGFAQAMVRNGGRNGVALTFGFRWALGKESEDL